MKLVTVGSEFDLNTAAKKDGARNKEKDWEAGHDESKVEGLTGEMVNNMWARTD
jgi:hypothetical protein